jgi:hypothetical protein
MFWPLMLIVAALLSIAVLNPIPIVAAIVLMAIGRTAEAPFVAEVKAAGRNPDLPRPTSGPGCVAFVLAMLAFGFLGLVGLGAVIAILEGGAR